MPEPEICFPKLELIERLKVDSFFIARQHELAKKIDEIKVKDKKYWGWLIYGWMLPYDKFNLKFYLRLAIIMCTITIIMHELFFKLIF